MSQFIKYPVIWKHSFIFVFFIFDKYAYVAGISG